MSTITLTPVAAVTGARQARPAARSGEVRLTRRGRLAVLGVSLVAMFGGGLLASTTSVASDSSEGFPTRVVMVAPGDTLWEIADDAAGAGSTADMVSTIQGLNDLSGGGVQAGQRLVVPLP
jgi:hypothetical protein